MTGGPGTEVRPCCAMCLIVPDNPAALRKWLEFVPYYLCTDRTACLDRATRRQHQARDAEEAVMRALAAEKRALEADVAQVKAAVAAEATGRHAATGPMKAITDAVVTDIQDRAAAASAQPDGPDQAEGVSP